MLRQATLLLLLSAPAFAASPVDALLSQGSQKFEDGDTDGALAAFDKANKLAPKDPRPYFMRGSALFKKGDAAGAEKGFRDALALDANLVEVRAELGALLVDRRRYAEAEKELKAAVAGKPDLSEAWFNLGQAELGLKQCPAALDAYQHAARIGADADAYINLSVAQRKCKALPEALAAARQAVKLARAEAAAPARLNLGLTLQANGKLDDAASALQEATRLKPDYATAWWSLGLVERERGKLDAAIAALQRSLQLRPQNPVRWNLAQTLAAAGKCKEALAELQRLPPDEAKSEAAQKLRARCRSKTAQ
jgi:tetratricopeptide (TPR) repeat protein